MTTAKTSRSETLATQGRLADLMATANILIRDGKRSQLQIDALLASAQLFKENRLAGVVSCAVEGHPENLLQILSMKVDEAFPKRIAQHVYAIYIGELFLAANRRWLRNRRQNKSTAAVCAALQEWGISEALDLDQVGWEPPYASDPNVLAAWATPLHEVRGGATCNGCKSVGESLRLNLTNWRNRGWYYAMEALGLHYAMYVPLSWTPPPHDPERCAHWGKVEFEGEWVPEHELEAHKTRKYGIPSDDPIFRRRVDEWELSIRTANCLKNDGIIYIGQLVKRSEAVMLRTPNFGRKSLNELKEVLGTVGLHFGMTVDMTWLEAS